MLQNINYYDIWGNPSYILFLKNTRHQNYIQQKQEHGIIKFKKDISHKVKIVELKISNLQFFINTLLYIYHFHAVFSAMSLF